MRGIITVQMRLNILDEKQTKLFEDNSILRYPTLSERIYDELLGEEKNE